MKDRKVEKVSNSKGEKREIEKESKNARSKGRESEGTREEERASMHAREESNKDYFYIKYLGSR